MSKLLPLSDFSAIRLSGLPVDSSPKSVASLLNSHGLEVQIECIRIFRQQHPPQSTAEIKVKDPDFASKCHDRLGRTLQVKTLPITFASGADARNIIKSKIDCSWHKSTRTVWLNYGTEYIAQRVSRRLQQHKDVPLRRTVNCGEVKRSRGFRNPLPFTIVLTGVPGAMSKDDISFAINRLNDKPGHVEIANPSYTTNDQEICAIIKSMFAGIGALEWWEADLTSSGKRNKVRAAFENEEDAQKTAQKLKDMAVPELRGGRLTVQLIYNAKFKIMTALYNAIKPEIDVLERAEKGLHFAYYKSTDTAQRFTTMNVSGEDFGEISRVKAALEKLLEGDIAMHNGKPLWSASLKTNGSSYEALQQIQKDTSVFIVRNKKSSQIQLYGSPESCAKAKEALSTMLRNETVDFVVELQPKQLLWVLNGGLKALHAALGQKAVRLDIASKPQKLHVMGSQQDYTTVMGLISRQEALDNLDLDDMSKDCAVCYTEAESPIQTTCNHTYCLDCFENLCTAATSDDKDCTIRCCGDGGKCSDIFTLNEIQENLSSDAFEGVLEASFVSYIRHRPEKFRYCPTADCSCIYSTTDTARCYKCPKCRIDTCTSCHNPFKGKTCREHEEYASGVYEELERYKKEHGIKDCPKCKTAIEKTEGCNHMTCGGCQTHICWVCLETFVSGPLCYDHMNRKHGGIGLGYLQRMYG